MRLMTSSRSGPNPKKPLMRRGKDTRDISWHTHREQTPREDTAKKAAIHQPGIETSPETNQAWLKLDLGILAFRIITK